MQSIKLYTEDKNIAHVRALVENYFDDAMIYRGGNRVGKRQWESALVIEVFVIDLKDYDNFYHGARELAEEIKRVNKQQSVMITIDFGLEVEFV